MAEEKEKRVKLFSGKVSRLSIMGYTLLLLGLGFGSGAVFTYFYDDISQTGIKMKNCTCKSCVCEN